MQHASTLRDVSTRAVQTVVEEIYADGSSEVESPRTIVASYAVIKNPWVNQSTTVDLTKYAAYAAPILAREISQRILDILKGPANVQAFGKAAIVGLNGEVEHGGAFIHTPFFGNIFRELLHGSSVICFSESRAEPSDTLRVPLWHKTAAATRDYYQSIELHIPDAPHPDELVVMGLASNGPRPHPRIGDRTTDPEVTLKTLQGDHS